MANCTFRFDRISFPEFAEYDERVKSYKSAPKGSFLHEHNKKLAAAGFFHTGSEDETLCFNCGGGIKAWRQEDIPWVEHAKWLPGCSFLLVNKGITFIQKHYKDYQESEIVTQSMQPQKTDKTYLQCVVCYSNEKNIFFLPCRHCCVCSECGQKLNKCAVCRENILSMMEIFLS